MIRPAKPSDAQSIVTIYNYYVLNTIATFEEDVVNVADITRRINYISEQNLPWLVAEHEGKVIGYAYASPWKGRCAYRFSAETTVYIAHTEKSKGWGKQLYTELMKVLKDSHIKSAIAGIALPNTDSVALHEKFNMKKVAHFEKVGFKFGQWIDVGYWQITNL